ncbi:MAG: helix-turn-helix domain-containing protein [Alphaproteobacteria bacterium]|nr:helix-turn-helix domain-containing protein [Alphaproteobacteria bacterium]
MIEPNRNHLLTRKEAAEYLGISEITLGLWKSTKRYNLPVVKMGRLAKYRYGDLLDFVERRTVNKEDAANNNSTRG